MLPAWLTILVVSRDVMIVGAVLVARVMHQPIAIAPLFVSKTNTAAQIALAAALLAAKAFAVDLSVWFVIATIAVAALTLASAGAYLARWLRHMAA